MEDFIVVTAENLEAVMQAAGSDQAKEFVPGCETWVIRDADGETGRMSRWPDGERGAIHWGADSRWGDWDGHGNLVIDDDGEVIDKTGTIVRASRLQMIAKMVRVRDFLLMGRPMAAGNVAMFDLKNGLKVKSHDFELDVRNKDIWFEGDVDAFAKWLAANGAHSLADEEIAFLRAITA
ncbi:hypothetical protein LTR94_003773 [Friedmanniomyces endolithicus]|nr:hypothetical protein LTR94_003773 [Friedmanniomyces endolithicus]